MFRKTAKALAGNKENYKTIGAYYRNVRRIEKEIKGRVVTAVLVVVIAVSLGSCAYYGLSQPWEGYVADYQDSNGVLHDTDGDGDMYHYHTQDITSGKEECTVCR